MYPNTKYSHVYYEAVYTHYCPVHQIKCPPICITFPFAKLYIDQINRTYSVYVPPNIVKGYYIITGGE